MIAEEYISLTHEKFKPIIVIQKVHVISMSAGQSQLRGRDRMGAGA